MAKISFYDIASVLMEHNGLTQSKANDFVKAMFDIIQERLPIDQQVKIKGLGTFKIIDVEDRESINVNTGERILIEGHSKITFTPDAAMKELINKPFSQFETVILKDGIVFDETKEEIGTDKEADKDVELNVILDTIAEPVDSEMDDFDSEEFASVEEEEIPVEEKKAVDPVEEEPISPAEEETVASVEEEETVVPEFIAETANTTVEEQEEAKPEITPIEEQNETGPEVALADEQEETEPEVVHIEEQEETESEVTEDYEDEEESSSQVKSVLLHVLYIVAIAALSAYGGYWYGVNYGSGKVVVQNVAKDIDKPKVEKVANKAILTDTIKKDSVKKAAVVDKKETIVDNQPVKPAQPVAAPTPAAKTESAVFDSDKYAAMDARVRTGAYVIIGEDYTMTVKKGETLSKLSKRTLGEGMECYIEVFNGISARTELQVGQKIKIPKLQRKKK
ncbi:MAG: HU family DNA-binding protein [Prevotella sp.]|nr:HU family DNA-binding protein [Prevotella sp.]